VLALNALLGLGTALAPVFVAIFVGLGFWWGLPVLAAVLLTVLLAVRLRGQRDHGPLYGLAFSVGNLAGPLLLGPLFDADLGVGGAVHRCGWEASSRSTSAARGSIPGRTHGR
jgi:hypothetical protein